MYTAGHLTPPRAMTYCRTFPPFRDIFTVLHTHRNSLVLIRRRRPIDVVCRATPVDDAEVPRRLLPHGQRRRGRRPRVGVHVVAGL